MTNKLFDSVKRRWKLGVFQINSCRTAWHQKFAMNVMHNAESNTQNCSCKSIQINKSNRLDDIWKLVSSFLLSFQWSMHRCSINTQCTVEQMQQNFFEWCIKLRAYSQWSCFRSINSSSKAWAIYISHRYSFQGYIPQISLYACEIHMAYHDASNIQLIIFFKQFSTKNIT